MADLGNLATSGGYSPVRSTAVTSSSPMYSVDARITSPHHVKRVTSSWSAGSSPAYPKLYTNYNNVYKHTAYWRLTTSLLHSSSCTGILSGKVFEDGAPLANAIVRIYHRPTGFMVGGAKTNSSGSWTVQYLESTDTGNYYAVSFDNNTGYNAVVMDKLTPA